MPPSILLGCNTPSLAHCDAVREGGIHSITLAHRLMGGWDPASTRFSALIDGDAGGDARPYPFALASPLEAGAEALGQPDDWLAEWKWDGIRSEERR